MQSLALAIALALTALAGCSSPPSTPMGDAGGCTTDLACDDGIQCSGTERCRPMDPAADLRGCVAGTSPCNTGETCVETPFHCVAGCAGGGDADGDGVRSIACGGTDCDDANADVGPSAVELCDAANVDEDCDPTTFGQRDSDSDGYFDATCCNGTQCGDDCDDHVAGVHPTETEGCDGVDQDCDAAIDEGVLSTFVVDADGDGYGSAVTGAATMQACAAPVGYAVGATDCDDAQPSVNPGAYDRCDAANVDDDCSGTANDPVGGCACAMGRSRACPLPGACAAGTQLCVTSTWADCSIAPGLDACGDALDQDCDGAIDEGCACSATDQACGTDVGACVRGQQHCGASGWGHCEGAVGPASEACNLLDDDCDGLLDEGVASSCYLDADGDGYAPAAASPVRGCGACPSGTTARAPGAMPDCDDGNGNAFPGQTGFFDLPRSNGTFDYDCNGGIVTNSPATACTTSASGGCVSAEYWTNAVALCGHDVDRGFCMVVGPPGGTFCVEGSYCMSTAPGLCGPRLMCH